jgi:hypothetical protein
LEACHRDNSKTSCSRSVMLCKELVESPISGMNSFDVYDVRLPMKIGPTGRMPNWPPSTYENFLKTREIQHKIGASRVYKECVGSVGNRFLRSGDGKLHNLPIV